MANHGYPMHQDSLHYPRTELAQSVLHLLSSGLSSALTLFAPRRMGKTEFLLRDLMPQAEQQGWRVFYHSFMEDDAGRVAQAFPAALADFSRPDGWLGRTAERLAGRVRLSGTLGPLTVGSEPSPEPAPTVSHSIAQLARHKRPVLLLLDEIQELARRRGTAPLVASLRTGLDRHKDRVKVIFTGSSQAGLRAMFGDARAPFFHFATLLDFPPLERGFTRHLAATHQRITGRALDEEQLWDAFLQLGRVPLHLRALVEELALNPGRGLEQALATRLAQLADTSGFQRRWQALGELERQLLLALGDSHASPYSQDTRHQLAQALGRDQLATSTVQTALRKLERRDYVTRDAHGWRLADPAFAEWIRAPH